MSYAEQQAVLNEQVIEQRFRAAVISSAATHLAFFLALLFGPMLIPVPRYEPSFTPVRLVQLPPPAAQPATPAEAPQEEAEAEPEPVQPVVSEPEPVPRSLAELQREREAEEQLRRDEAERQHQAELERQRRAEEERRRREDEARRQPQRAGQRPPAQSQSARRTGIDVTQSGDSGYTVEEFPFADYLYRIRDLIAAQWSPPPSGPYGLQRRTEVFFRLGRNGRLVVQPRVEDGSGDTTFDRAAMRAVAAAAPFPPLPREYDGQSLGVGLAFVTE